MSQTIFKSPKNEFQMVGKHIECKGASNVGKITGTLLGAILGQHSFKTPFGAAIDMFGLADADLSANPAINAGKVLEDPLVKYAKTALKEFGTFLTAEDIFGNRGDNPHIAPSDFEHPIFGGHIDGAVIEPDGQQYVLEVKTTKDTDYSNEWFVPLYDVDGNKIYNEDGSIRYRHDGVPDHYYWQVALYNEFVQDMQKDYVYFLVGFMDEAAYENPLSWQPHIESVGDKKGNVALLKVHIDRAELREKLAYAENWYHQYIENGITPDYEFSSNRDYELWNHLLAISAPLGVIQAEIDRFNYLDKFIKEMTRERDQLKDNIKTRMNKEGMAEMISERGLRASVSVQTRKSVDTKRIIKEFGIDEAAYITTTSFPVFNVEDPVAVAMKKAKKKSKE